ncbi:MAG: VOC family protein [Leptolyngbya sp. SIOISBB]|nr:VOC family protein [Leptolyngbya sp. SIOISBB]
MCSEVFVTLATLHLNELAKFYEALLAAPPQAFMPDRYAEFTVTGFKLALFHPQAAHEAEFSQPANAAMSLCLEVADLEGAIAHLTQLGYPPAGPLTQASHGREIYAYDPDGNRLILHQSPE